MGPQPGAPRAPCPPPPSSYSVWSYRGLSVSISSVKFQIAHCHRQTRGAGGQKPSALQAYLLTPRVVGVGQEPEGFQAVAFGEEPLVLARLGTSLGLWSGQGSEDQPLCCQGKHPIPNSC